MTINIENGSGEMYVGLTDSGSYFTFREPIASSWFCCFGTLAKFLCVSNGELNNTNSIQNIRDNLHRVFTNNTEELANILNPILQKLKNGTYGLGFIEGEKQVILPRNIERTWNVYLANKRNRKLDEIEILMDFKKFEKGYSQYTNKLIYTTTNYYDNHTYRFIGTQSQESIDENTVKRYEQIIKEGTRPFAIVMSSYYQPDADIKYPYTEFGAYEADWYSEKFIIDGHHKLLAYRNLGVKPNYAHIYQGYEGMLNTYFKFEDFSKFLYSWQSEHFMKNWESGNKYLDGKRIEY